MIEVGDKVVCIQSTDGNEWVPPIKSGTFYIVNSMVECCGRVWFDIGLSYKKPASLTTCPVCKKLYSISVPMYEADRFRKIEPEYRAISVPESITEQAKTLLTPETVAQ